MTIFKLKKRKGVAIFMLTILLGQILTPSIVFALTSGPTAPEATNFEPIDTTDMVNPLTGGFTYSLPLLEVPGPEGSYPLALSYHAGIQPNEEASWVGLGWSLNPGAIARNVNGYPDDWKGVSGTERDFWAGGSTSTESIGLDLGMAGSPASANFGLSFSEDTYKGFGIGSNLSVGSDIEIGGLKLPYKFGVQLSVDPYGGAYASAGISYSRGFFGSNGLAATGNLGVSTNFKNLTAYASVGVTMLSTGLGSSIGTNEKGSSLTLGSIGSISSVNNANKGKLSTFSWGLSLPIPLGAGVSLSLGYSHVRYWSDETTGFIANGVINSRTSISGPSDLNLSGDDNRLLLDPNLNIYTNPDPVEQLGGTFPNFDDYNVTAQGLSGSMRPYAFSAVLFNQNRIVNNNQNINSYGIVRSSTGSPNTKWQFRFTNQLSNSYTQQFTDDSGLDYTFDTAPKVGAPSNDADNFLNKGYDSQTNRLEGTSHIEYFTNDQIEDTNPNSVPNQRGFIKCPETAGFIRKSSTVDANVGSQIGGFMITNGSGVTYHYALPAYSYQEIIHTESRSGGTNYNELHKPAPYAYTWYLTAITGPDYVSRGVTKGFIDPSDWGYWVKFDYGQWTDNYGWRNPSEGFQRDQDVNFQTFSAGKKELYYLDAVETRTHTAVFEKEMRLDAKGNAGLYNGGGSYPGVYTPQGFSFCNVSVTDGSGNTSTAPTGAATNTPKTTMRLDNIYIFDNSQLPANVNTVRQSGAKYNSVNNSTLYTANSSSCDDGSSTTYTDVLCKGEDVIDTYDIQALDANGGWTSKCLRKIAFSYNYQLTPGTPNSYDPQVPSKLLGKLTLQAVDFQGKGGVAVTPPIQFQYDLDPTNAANFDYITCSDAPASNQSGVNQYAHITTQSFNKFTPGDILSFVIGTQTYYCTITAGTDGYHYQVLLLNSSPGNFINIQATKTKNPPYNKDTYDQWGCYKSDYVPSLSNNENLARFTTKISNTATDVWSLRKIQSSIGSDININYEGNTYNKSVLNLNRSLMLTSFTRNSANNYSFTVNNENTDLTNVYQVGDTVSLLLEKDFIFTQYAAGSGYSAIDPVQIINSKKYTNRVVIQTVNSANSLTVTVDPQMDNDITTTAGCKWLNIQLGTRGTYGTNQTLDVTPTIICGNVSANGCSFFYGGGVRVQSIIVDDLNGQVKGTAYNYGNPGNYGVRNTSGVTSYQPLVFDAPGSAIVQDTFFPNPIGLEFTSTATYPWILYNSALYAEENKLLAIADEVPSPGVMYEFVTVSDFNVLSNGTQVPIEGSTMYQYEVFKPEMINFYDYYNPGPTQGTWAGQTIDNSPTLIVTKAKKDRSIVDYTSRIGNLKRMVTYDNYGNKLTEKINHYVYDNLDNSSFQNQFNNYGSLLNTSPYYNIGVIKERYASSRYLAVSYDNHQYQSFVMISDRETYPSIQTGSTQIDYKNGTTVNQSNLAYDYYTGAVTKTLTYDSYGNRFINQVTPAYMANNGTSLAYPAIGLQTFDDDPTNANYSGQHKQMLSQESSNYTFNVSSDGKNTPLGVVSASVQTWGNDVPIIDQNGNSTTVGQANIWRQEATYAWMPLGASSNNITPYASFADFYAVNGSSNTSWKKTAQASLYNVYSAALEGYDINNNYSASHMGYNNSKVIVSANLANYNEIAYTGAEDFISGNTYLSNNISIGTGSVVTNDSTKAHTGLNSVMLNQNQSTFIYTVPLSQLHNNNYSVSVWVKSTNYNSTGGLFYTIGANSPVYPTMQINKNAAGWYLLEMTIPSTAIISGSGNLQVGLMNKGVPVLYCDDFKFQPSSAATTAYVYDQATGELTYIIGNNGLYTRFQYDQIGRLVRTYKEVLGKSTTPISKSISYNYGRFAQPNWQNTGVTQCQQSPGGSNTGFSLIQQEDINPLSATYKQTRLLQGPISSGCPVTIYARLTQVYGNNLNNVYTATLSVNLFSDPAGTVPYNLNTPLGIQLRDAQTGVNGNQTYTGSYLIPAGSNVLTIPNIQITGCATLLNPFTTGGKQSGPYCTVTNVITLSPQIGYTVLPPNNTLPVQ